MATNYAHSTVLENVAESATSAYATISSQPASSNHGSHSTLIGIMAVVGAILFLILSLFYFSFKSPQRRTVAISPPRELLNPASVYRTHGRDAKKRIMTMDELNYRFPTKKYKLWRGAPPKDFPKYTPCPTPASSRGRVNSLLIRDEKQQSQHGSPKIPLPDSVVQTDEAGTIFQTVTSKFVNSHPSYAHL